jgi:hydroxyacylglutathione hydrolase
MLERITVGPFGTNCYLYNAAIIDPGAEPERILAAVEKGGIEPEWILLTHGHFDHIQALPSLLRSLAGRGKRPKIAIHRLDASFLGDGGLDTQLESFSRLGAMGKRYVVERYEESPGADLLFDDGSGIEELGLEVIHTPGHTRGSVGFYSPGAGLLFSGDTMFAGSIGRSDLPGGDPFVLGESLARLSKLPPETVVWPGHGEATDIASERVR